MSKRFLMLCCFTVAAAAAFMLSVNISEAQGVKKANILLFTRSQGFIHGPAKWIPSENGTLCGRALKKYLADKNIEITETQDGGVFDGNISKYDAFLFYTSGNLSKEDEGKDKNGNDRREPQEHAISTAGLAKLIDAVKAGKGFVGFHSATDSQFDTGQADDIYTKFIGGRFVSHNAQQIATATAAKPYQVPWIKTLPDGKDTVWEEWYTMKWFNPDMHVLLVQETAGMQGPAYQRPNYPSSWIRKEGSGRVAYLAYGHRDDFWENPEKGFSKEYPQGCDANLKKVSDVIEWALGRYELDTTPNLKEVAPEAETLP